MANVKEVPAFKADWPGTVHKTYEEARQANITYLSHQIFGARGDEEPYDTNQFDAARLLVSRINSDKRNGIKNFVEALAKEL